MHMICMMIGGNHISGRYVWRRLKFRIRYYSIRSMRRNPVIADLFHRMKYMERPWKWLRKIVSETEKLPGYSEIYKPEFFSTATDFRVILKNVNYHLSQKDLVSDQDCDQVSDQDRSQDIYTQSWIFCITEKANKKFARLLVIEISLILQENI